jgi:hypothetical protein
MTDDRSSDGLSAAERATVRRLIDEINEFNVEATGIRDFHELAVATLNRRPRTELGPAGYTNSRSSSRSRPSSPTSRISSGRPMRAAARRAARSAAGVRRWASQTTRV